MIEQLLIEVEADDDGFHSIVVEVGTDCVLHVSNTFALPEQAEAAAREWIDHNQ